MLLREVIFRMITTFAIAVSSSIAAIHIMYWVGHTMHWAMEFTDPYWLHRLIGPFFLIAFLTSLTWFFAYAKDGLTSNQMLFRYLLAFVSVVCIVVGVMEPVRRFYEWTWGLDIYVMALFFILITFLGIAGFSTLHAKNLADECNRDLARRQKKAQNGHL